MIMTRQGHNHWAANSSCTIIGGGIYITNLELRITENELRVSGFNPLGGYEMTWWIEAPYCCYDMDVPQWGWYSPHGHWLPFGNNSYGMEIVGAGYGSPPDMCDWEGLEDYWWMTNWFCHYLEWDPEYFSRDGLGNIIYCGEF